MAVQPTGEQEDARGLFATGMNMAIEAGAGTGKSSTLVMLAEDRPLGRGRYVVFNRAAALDAQRRFPSWVACSTINSVAARATDRALLNRLDSPRVPSWRTAQILGISKSAVFSVDGNTRMLTPSWLAGYVTRALRTFCYSADPHPTARHFDPVAAVDKPGETVNNDDLADNMLPALERAWADVQHPDGKLRYTHDVCLKAWALGDASLDCDFLLADEVQDFSAVQIDVFARQPLQVAWTGDSSQSIYSWRGSANALAKVPTDLRTYLTRSFRFGPPIADLANRVLDLLPTELRLSGTPTIDSAVAPVPTPDAVLTRTNAVAVERVLRYQERNVPVHLVGGGGEVLTFANAALRLQQDGQCDHPELGCFDSWRAVQAYVADDPLGDELRLMVDLVDKFGAEVIIEALDDCYAEDQADVVVSTAHKAKGREWNRVQLASDFPELADCDDEEFRLFYVAVTRARFVVDPFHTPLYHKL